MSRGELSHTDDSYMEIRYIVGIICQRLHWVEKGSGHDYVLTRALTDAYHAGIQLDSIKNEAKLATNFVDFVDWIKAQQ